MAAREGALDQGDGTLDQGDGKGTLDRGDEGVTALELRLVEGVSRADRAAPCPACGRAITQGQDVVTTLGDMRRGVVGVTVHARCFSAVGRPGLLELMRAAFEQQRAT